MKARTLLLVFALFFAAVAGAFAQTPIRDTAVLLVGAEAADGSRSICSGVVLAPSRILTAKHCLNALFIARISDGRLHADLRVARIAPDGVDLLLIFAPGVTCPCATVAQILFVQEPVVASGYPDGVWTETTGQVFGLGRGPNYVFLVHSAPTAPGASGGGLWQLQNEQWVLVGINSALTEVGEYLWSLAVPHILFPNATQ